MFYTMNQLYMIKSEYLQRGLNLLISIFMMMYLLIVKPFKEKSILVSNIVSWAFNFVLFLIIFLKSFIIFLDDDYFDFLFIGVISGQILFQYSASLIILILK